MKKSASKKNVAPKATIYETVTARIIESLKAGVIPWAKAWQGNTTGTAFPSNSRTGAPYRGLNVLLLWGSPYVSPYWLTFKQAQELGGSVRKGEKGRKSSSGRISTSRRTTLSQIRSSREATTARFLCRTYTVFNVEQCDGLGIPAPMVGGPQIDTCDACEIIVGGSEARPTLHLDNQHQGRFLPSRHGCRAHAHAEPLCRCSALLLRPVPRAHP